jgi:hypothetical protein
MHQHDFPARFGLWILGMNQHLDVGLGSILNSLDTPPPRAIRPGPKISGHGRKMCVSKERLERLQDSF